MAVALSMMSTLPVSASIAEPEEAAQSEIAISSARMPYAADGADYLWMWSKGRRAYQLAERVSGLGYRKIRAFDADTGSQVAEEPLDPGGYAVQRLQSNTDHMGRNPTMVVDEDGGRLFVATQTPFELAASGAGKLVAEAAAGTPCGFVLVPPVCFNGVSVLDAQTLQSRRHMRFRSLNAEGVVVAPQLLAMEYAPPVNGQPAKLHALVQEWVQAPTNSDFGGGAKYWAPNSTVLVQFDPESGAQDWAVRVDSCRGDRFGTSNNDILSTFAMHDRAALFRGRGPGDHAVYVACTTVTQSLTVGVVRVPLDEQGRPAAVVQLREPSPDGITVPSGPPSGSPDAPHVVGETPTTVEGPDRAYTMLADAESGRFLVQVIDGSPPAMVWWVFDTPTMQFVGTIGIGGPVKFKSSFSGLSRRAGRLYLLAAPVQDGGHHFAGGLFVADVRRTPVPQALVYPEFASDMPDIEESTHRRWTLSVDDLPQGGTRLWRIDDMASPTEYRSIDDRRALPEIPALDGFEGRTLDLIETPGVTTSQLDGAARGYGARILLVGGAEAAARVGPADPLGNADQCNDPVWADYGSGLNMNSPHAIVNALLHGDAVGVFNEPHKKYGGAPCDTLDVPLARACTQGSREVVLAAVGPGGPVVVDSTGTRGAAQPIIVDSATITDLSAPGSRCGEKDWADLWGTALFGRPPAGEPGHQVENSGFLAQCIAGTDRSSGRVGDEVHQSYSAEVDCEEENAAGHAYARVGQLGSLRIGEALSSFRVYRDPDRGIVSRVESAVRGLDFDGLIRIDTVRGTAESWANGRRQPVAAAAWPESYDPNCDFERTAGSCFTRHLFGVRTPGWSCGPCGDEEQFVRAMNAAVGAFGAVRLREPDQRLRLGAENGFIAAIQKPESERFADLTLNHDVLQTVLPTLEFIRYAAPNRPLSRQGGRGRQIYQFAGVEVSSSYGIACLLVYDEASNTCAEPAEPPGAIQVSLSDSDGKPLAGGAFEVRQDADADGVLGLKDTLLPDGACVTAADGVGTCKLDNLQPGSYLVAQEAAPPGYAKSAEPFVVELASGEQRTVAFTNVSNLSTVDIKATDEAGAPLAGASFAAYPDPDSDGKVAPDAKPAAECTTNAEGACQMKVPAGSYVLVQTGAPGGLEGIEPVAFTFASGGQVAAVSVVNYPPGVPQAPEAPASPVYTPPVDQAPPVEIVDDSYVAPADTGTDVVEEPEVSVPERIGGTVTQVIRAPGDALRLLARDPKQAIAWTAALALFVLAAMAVRRRQQAIALFTQHNL